MTEIFPLRPRMKAGVLFPLLGITLFLFAAFYFIVAPLISEILVAEILLDPSFLQVFVVDQASFNYYIYSFIFLSLIPYILLFMFIFIPSLIFTFRRYSSLRIFSINVIAFGLAFLIYHLITFNFLVASLRNVTFWDSISSFRLQYSQEQGIEYNIPIDIFIDLGTYYFGTNQNMKGYFAFFFILKIFSPNMFPLLEFDYSIIFGIFLLISLPLYYFFGAPCSCEEELTEKQPGGRRS